MVSPEKVVKLKTQSKELDARLDDLALEAASIFKSAVQILSASSESPIETAMVAGFVTLNSLSQEAKIFKSKSDYVSMAFQSDRENKKLLPFVAVVPQWDEVLSSGRTVRYDFLLISGGVFDVYGDDRVVTANAVAVECDGFEWHDRTKEQFIDERKRCRESFADGIPVVRFAGTEIWASPFECAQEAVELAKSSLCPVQLRLFNPKPAKQEKPA